MEKDKKYILRYALLDYIATLIAWQLFNIYRFYEVRSTVYRPFLSSLYPLSIVLWGPALISNHQSFYPCTDPSPSPFRVSTPRKDHTRYSRNRVR